jgi:hypothetical protein
MEEQIVKTPLLQRRLHFWGLCIADIQQCLAAQQYPNEQCDRGQRKIGTCIANFLQSMGRYTGMQ